MTRPSSSEAMRRRGLLSVALCLALSACGGGGEDSGAGSGGDGALKIGLAYDIGGRGDQ